MVTPADVLAALDVLREVTEQSDSLDFDEAVELLDATRELRQVAGETISFLEMGVLAQVEAAPREHGGRVFKSVPAGALRYEHDAIEATVVREARTVREATDMMRRLYVSDSTPAKVGVLERLGVDPRSVRHREGKGRRLYVVEAEGSE